MVTQNQLFFEASCKVHGIPVYLGHKIIDGRYKPYLSALDDQYYNGSTVYDAKYEALNQAIKKFGRDKVIKILKRL